MKISVNVATALVAASVLLTACGGGDADVAKTTSAETPAANTPTGLSATATSSLVGATGPAAEAAPATAAVAPVVASSAVTGPVAADVAGTVVAVVPSPSPSPSAAANPTAPVSTGVVTTNVTASTTSSVTTSAVAPAASLLTVPEYKASRSLVRAVASDPVPNAAALATLAAANRRMAVTQLAADLVNKGGNPAVVPPLAYAAFRTLTAASSGDTLAQINNSGLDTAPVQYVAALQTNRVTSQLWSDRTRRFTPAFLAATDTLGPWSRLANWSAFETGFADGSFATDAGLISGLAQADPNLTVSSLPATKNLRLLTTHSVAEKASWAAVTPFDGIFDGGQNEHDLLQMPMVKVTAGVKRFAGRDFTADSMPMAGGLQLISLRPSAGTLAAYSGTRLEAALAEVQQGLLAAGAKPVAGEMILPKVDINLNIDPRAVLARAGISLPFDEVNANFRAMDGLGGVYAKPIYSSASLRVGSDGMTVNAVDATAFTFSPLNIFYTSDGAVVTTNITIGFGGIDATFGLFTCAWPTPDLRNFFLVVLDAQGSVVSIAAIQAPPGNEVKPTRTAYNPWAANSDNWTFPGDMKGVYPIVRGITFQGQGSPTTTLPPLVDVAGQSSQFGFVENPLYTYSHQTCVK
jgi:hypothetical protein